MKALFPLVIVSLVILPQSAPAQRVIPTPGSQPPVQTMPPPNAVPSRNVPDYPIPQSTVDQARDHIEGNYTEMTRAATGGSIQEAWDKQPEAGSQLAYDYCTTCVYKIRTREMMVSLIKLPEGELVAELHNGDPQGFKAGLRPKEGPKAIVSVQPNGFGMDTNITVIGTSGRIYPFYVRAESVNSAFVPDLVVRINGSVDPDAGVILGEAPGAANTQSGNNLLAAFPALEGEEPAAGESAEAAQEPKEAKKPERPDFLKSVPFDPAKLHGWGKYRLWGQGWQEKMMPESVFRDDYFTYIHFGDNWNNIELPVAYVVIDEIDELVNTRVNGTTFIVESKADLISLKVGQKYLCIEWTGEGGNTSERGRS